MSREQVVQNFVLTQMTALSERDVEPTFSAFQNTESWRAIRLELPRERLRDIILAWDATYERLLRVAQPLS